MVCKLGLESIRTYLLDTLVMFFVVCLFYLVFKK